MNANARLTFKQLRTRAMSKGYAFVKHQGQDVEARFMKSNGSVQFKIDGAVRSAFDVLAFLGS